MKIRLLIATDDAPYADQLSEVVSEKYTDTFEVTTCYSPAELGSRCSAGSFDVALFTADMAESMVKLRGRIKLLVVLEEEQLPEIAPDVKSIRKYQRISSITGQVLELYSAFGDPGRASASSARVTAVWSPAGGSGKTTFAVALAAKASSMGKRALYLDLEAFSSVDVYFEWADKGLSTVLESLDKDVNLELLLQSIRREDSGSGVYYYCRPDNYDDLNILTVEDLTRLLDACRVGMDEVIVDLSSFCDERVRAIFDRSDRIVAVLDATRASEVKWRQFTTQNDLYAVIRGRLTLAANRGARADAGGAGRVLSLPTVQSADPIAVYKTLSASCLDNDF